MSRSLTNRLLIILIAVELCMVVIYWIDISAGPPRSSLSRLFDLNLEGTVPAWFSSMQLAFLSAALVTLRSLLVAADGKKYLGLALLASAALFFSADEMLSLHERLNEFLIHLQGFPRFKYNNGSWLFIYLPLLAIIATVCGRELMGLRERHPRPIAFMGIGVALALVGAVALEIINYQYLFHHRGGFWYLLEVGLEELFEMLGVS